MLRTLLTYPRLSNGIPRCFSIAKRDITKDQPSPDKFETVFSFSFIKYISLLNRLKVYQIFGTSVAIPSCGLMEALNVIPSGGFLATSYIGLTGVAVLSVATLPFRNTIGYLYISEDNEKVKISSMDFWGRRKDRIISANDWIPMLDLSPKKMDAIFLTPELTDGTKYKLFIKFGKVLNSKKMDLVLE